MRWEGISGLVAGGLFWVATVSAHAAYPEHHITIIVPFAAGGAVDLFTRMIAPHLSEVVGQPVVVENKPGADGILGISAVAHAKPDGYTLLFSAGAEVLAPALHRTIPYDPVKEIAPVAELAFTPNTIGVSAKTNINSVAELVERAKQNPGKLNAAESGNGGRLSIELFQIQTGTKIETVQYSGGGQVMTSLASGETDLTISDSLSFAAGRTPMVKALAVAGEKRVPAMPDVPTTKEVGFPNFVVGTTYTVYAPGGTSSDIIVRLHDELNKIAVRPDVVDALSKIGLVSSTKSLDSFRSSYLNQLGMWQDIVEKANIPKAN